MHRAGGLSKFEARCCGPRSRLQCTQFEFQDSWRDRLQRLVASTLRSTGQVSFRSLELQTATRRISQQSGGAFMKNSTSAWLAGILVIATAGSLAAHHSLAQFDTTTAVRVKGTISRVELVNPHSLIFVDQKAADGQTQRWA